MRHARSDYNRIQDPENKIPDEEPVFLIRGQDVCAPAVLRFYAQMAAGAGASQTMVDLVNKQADEMDGWQDSVNCKTPDLIDE